MPQRANSITFVIPGQKQAPNEAARGAQGTVKESVRVGARRGGGESVRISATPGEDVVVLHIANGPALYLHPESARDLMLAQTGRPKRGERDRSTTR